mmetsp:Transcript_30585/g.56642  ORF Transcript_30585/g.56642 Transcript_30585/m.56642 type:complete len:799 (-) Transcript_30585:161-2557(-)|eukprot:CAMPEP_0197442276 /NCGR_PEP_ID=MMETSP1175-20131217/8324_1 /TAXON_ID=1003142 /ORGANISM="Triceratium dubium, Strain CCMP147" /LENGTH=798 /DNA_ID=CAMNT_0042972713 /DNA_START=575 /DNA_END=2971 /DNA_ORIENTATION=-
MPLGQSISLNVYYADNDLCDPNVDTRGGYPARVLDENGQMLPWPAPYILMVDRGGCTFVQKVRHAQRAGAAAVVIADDVCICSFGDSCIPDEEVVCETRFPTMADDGSGGDISIPSVLLFKQDADLIKAELTANLPVLMELSWELEGSDRVEYEMWTTPTDVSSQIFLSAFSELAIALGGHVYFTPHMFIYDGIKAGCMSVDGENMCYNLCTNNGRYCMTDPDNSLDEGISGAQVVEEALRRMCIWELYGKADGLGIEWWMYVNAFDKLCSLPEFFTQLECISESYQLSGIDKETVDRCMLDSGGLDSDEPNAMLDGAIRSAEQRGVITIPSIFVNGIRLQGALSTGQVLRAICSVFGPDSTIPNVCLVCATCPGEYCVKYGTCPQGNNTTAPAQAPQPSGDAPSQAPHPFDDGISYEATACPAVGMSSACKEEESLCRGSDGRTAPCILFENGGTCNCDSTPCQCSGRNFAAECPGGDGRVCQNGGLCVEVQGDSQAFYCDCVTAFAGGVPHSGLSCEHPATSLCSVDYTSFCTNGGDCITITSPGQPHAGCRCPDAFEGAFCQLLKQQVTGAATAVTQDTGDNGSLGGWKLALAIVLPVVALVCFMSFFLLRNRNKGSRDSRDQEVTGVVPLPNTPPGNEENPEAEAENETRSPDAGYGDTPEEVSTSSKDARDEGSFGTSESEEELGKNSAGQPIISAEGSDEEEKTEVEAQQEGCVFETKLSPEENINIPDKEPVVAVKEDALGDSSQDSESGRATDSASTEAASRGSDKTSRDGDKNDSKGEADEDEISGEKK